MKKKVLLIGNDDGLPGVKVDLKNFKRFFKSQVGGNWYDSEIEEKINPTKIELQVHLQLLQLQNLDHLIVIFSGHGGQERETVLEINSKGETISESELKNLSKRQITIFDCCRCYPESISESLKFEAFAKSMSASGSTRDRYERRLLQAIPQQISLYSCSIGEVSNDTSEGGVYSKNLILSAKENTSEYKLVGSVHQGAYEKVMEYNRTVPSGQKQHPEAVLPRCLSTQQLIFGIRP